MKAGALTPAFLFARGLFYFATSLRVMPGLAPGNDWKPRRHSPRIAAATFVSVFSSFAPCLRRKTR
jgi:hypothetical protein